MHNILDSFDKDQVVKRISGANEIRDAIFESLKEGVDYFVSQKESFGPRNVLKKSGAETIASALNIEVSMGDIETLKVNHEGQGAIIFTVKAYAKNSGDVIAEGVSSRSSHLDSGDVNSTTKIMYKSAYIDVILRATGMTRHFTQDLIESPVTNYFQNVKASNDGDTSEEDKVLIEKIKVSLGIRTSLILAQRNVKCFEELSHSALVQIAEDEFIGDVQETEEVEEVLAGVSNKEPEKSEPSILIDMSNSRTPLVGLSL